MPASTLVSGDRRDRRTALDLVNAVTATLISRFEEGALGTTMRLGISSSTDCTAGCRVSAPSSWPGGPFEVDQHAVSASTLARSLVHVHPGAARPEHESHSWTHL